MHDEAIKAIWRKIDKKNAALEEKGAAITLGFWKLFLKLERHLIWRAEWEAKTKIR